VADVRRPRTRGRGDPPPRLGREIVDVGEGIDEEPIAPPSGTRRRLAVNTAIFAVATALSRVAGLGREVVQAGYFGTSGEGSAFTIASQIPNLFSNLFSQAALGAAFVPIFTELLQQGRKKEAFRLASSLFWLILVVLGALTVLYMGIAGIVMPLFAGKLTDSQTVLATGLSRVLFPVVLLLSLTGLMVAILQSYDEFSIPALAPAVWNVVIIVGMVVLHSQFHGQNEVYSYAVAWLIATVVQMLLVWWAMRRLEFRFSFAMDWRDPRVRQVLILFFPVTISIGIINLDIFINAGLGALVSEHAPIAINDAFRIYMLPQGIFSVAVATVLFPTLSRMASARDPKGMRRTLGNGIRQINLMLIPAAALLAVLAVPITRVVYQHGAFGPASTHRVSVALFWFAWSLPFAGVNLLLTRTFFALQRPWIPTKLAAINIVADLIVSLALYKPLGITGLVLGTVVANVVMTWLQLRRLRQGFNGRLELGQTTMITSRILVATALVTLLGWLLYHGLDAVLGNSFFAGIIELVIAGGLPAYLYARLVLAMRIPEANQVQQLIMGRLRGR
jgi:putative peptidoglycan lipid II flippase